MKTAPMFKSAAIFSIAFAIAGLESAYAQKTNVYSLSFGPAAVGDATIPPLGLNLTVSIGLRYNLGSTAGFADVASPWDSEFILETANASTTIYGYPDSVTSQSCPTGSPAGSECYLLEFNLTVDSTWTTGTYSPTLIAAYYVYVPLWFGYGWVSDNIAPAAFLAAGLPQTFLLFPGTTPPTGGGGGTPPPGCTIPAVTGGSPTTGISDTTPPFIDGGVCFNPAVVDVRTAASKTRISMRIKDDLAGFSNAFIYAYSPNSSQYQYIYLSSFHRTSGNDFDGVYEIDLNIPLGAASGTWTIQLTLVDRTGNQNYIYAPAKPGAPDEQAVFEVVSNPDTDSPVLQSISYSVPSVNVTAGPVTVKARVRLTDVGLGVDLSQTYFVFSGPTTENREGLTGQNIQRISGDANDGMYEMDLPIPRYAQTGAWRIAYGAVADFAGNTAFLNRDFNPPPATSFSVASTPSDNFRPNITSLTAAPAFINTTSSPQTVFVNFTATDDLAGIRNPFGCYGWFRSPSGDQTAGGFFATLITGGSLSGVYRMEVYFAQFAEIGTWRLNSMYCTDNALNWRYYSAADLAALGFDRPVVVIQPSNNTDGNIPPTGGTFKDNASETTLVFPPGAVPTNTTIAIDVLAEPPAIPAPAGFARATGFVSVELTPKPTAPFPAPGVTMTIPLESQLPQGTTLVLYKVNPSTGTLVPAVSVTGGPVEGIVNAGGLSATFTGISGFSTVVGLTPPGRLGDLNGDNQVNCEDITLIRNSWNKRQGQAGFDSRADFNRDRVVNLLDLSAVARYLPRRTRCN